MDGDSESQIELKGSPSKTKHLIKDFCNYTTTHGVGRLAEAKTIFSRFIWSIFILGSLSMFIYQTSGLFGLYLSRPISTVVKVKHKTVSQNKSVVIYLLQIHSTALQANNEMKKANTAIQKKCGGDNQKSQCAILGMPLLIKI